MKSWSLGRSSSKKEKKDKSPNRPKSMIMSMPTASSSTELITSIQASPSLSSYTSKEKSSPTSLRSKKDDTSPVSAKRYLSSAQLKDQARREDIGPVTYSATSSPSSRAPLAVKENGKENERVFGHQKRRSIPSLIRSPFNASPTPSTAVLSPTAAVARKTASSEHSQGHHNESALVHLESRASLTGSASMGSIQIPPSPTRSALTESSPPRTRLTSITSDIPARHEILRTPRSSKEKNRATKEPSLEEQEEDQASAVASLRRLKEIDSPAMADARQLDPIESMITVGSQGSLEEVKESGKPEEAEPASKSPSLLIASFTSQDEASNELQAEKDVIKNMTPAPAKVEKMEYESKNTEIADIHSKVDEMTKVKGFAKKEEIKATLSQAKKEGVFSDKDETQRYDVEQVKVYPYVIRKSNSKNGSAVNANTSLMKKEQQSQHARRIEAKVQLAIVTQKRNQVAARYIITTPIPALLSADHFASWTVERLSRITSCIIQIFGS